MNCCSTWYAFISNYKYDGIILKRDGTFETVMDSNGPVTSGPKEFKFVYCPYCGARL